MGQSDQAGNHVREVDVTLGACGNYLLIASVSSVRVTTEQKELGDLKRCSIRRVGE